MPDQQEHTIVLGGGIAGLATGYELARRGQKVTILEKNPDAGGLARTLVFDNFRFDIGGHRFHSNNEDVVNWVKELLGPDLLRVPRISHIRLGQKYVSYPLEFPSALNIFPPITAARMVASYILAQFTQRNKPILSFEDWVVARFGRALFDVYFGPYTRKVWGIPTDELSAQWAAQRIGIPSLTQAVLRLLRPKHGPALATAITEFYYPRQGFGMITDRLQEEVEAMGSQVITRATVKTVNPDTGVVTYELDGATHEVTGDRVVSTIPLSLLLRMLPQESGASKVAEAYKLDYRDIIVVDLALNCTQVSTDSWTYFPDPKLIFGRTHEPKNWSAEMVPSPD
ncbi:MAG: FAD-dependent oxidoreductase, partial [Anaerolineae bacterium]|nr:FAD-dependent oxidoreductase [Anaerolineae bacterium]